MIKNNHNKEVGSNVERTDKRIDLTGEVLTPICLLYTSDAADDS